MPSIDCLDHIEIQAPAALVYRVVSDYANWSQWNPSYNCYLLDAEVVTEGARVHHQFGKKPFILSDFIRRVDVMCEAEGLEETYLEGDLVGTGVWQFEEREGVTRAAYHCKVDSNTAMTHISFLLLGGKAHSNVYQALLKRLKAHCEALARELD